MLLGQTSMNWTVLFPIITGFLAVCYLLPTPRHRPLVNGILALVVAVFGFGVFLFKGLGRDWPFSTEMFLFTSFSLMAFTFAVLMIAQRNPARAALFFAVVVLSVCGLFLLLAAPFLMAATIIIYAGAIVVTFLFVIMLAQQGGQTDANDRSREPSLAAAVGFVILGTLLVVLQRVYDTCEVDELIRQSEIYAKADTLDPSLKEPERAKRFLDDVVRVRSELGYDKLDIPNDINGMVLHEKSSDPVEEMLRTLDLIPPVFEPMPGMVSGGLKINMAEVRQSAAEIHYELTYLKAVRDGRITAVSKVQAEDGRQVVLSPHARSWNPTPGDHPAQLQPQQLPNANIAALGRTLYTDHLLSIELGGTLLLVATIGAIAIAGGRPEKAA